MNSREVMSGLLRREKVERMGLHDAPWPDTLRKWTQEGYPVDEQGNPVIAEEHFRFDDIYVGDWMDITPMPGHAEVVEETDEWVIRRNGAGAALKWWKNKSGTPEHVDFRMTSRAIWETDYRPHLLDYDPSRFNIENSRNQIKTRREQGFFTYTGNMFIWENMRQSFGDVCMFESLITDPEWIKDYAQVYTDFFKRQYGRFFQEAGVPDGFWMYEDLGYANGLICSPGILEELIFPYYKELVDFVHSYDIPVVLHACGRITDALPLIVAAGFDALNPMQVKAGCNALKFAEQYGDRLAFVGGLDARILESGDRELIRKEVVRLMEGMKSLGASYVFGSDHSLSTNIRYADFQFALDVYREHMFY